MCFGPKEKSCSGSRASWTQKRLVTAEKMPAKSLKGQKCYFFINVHLVYFLCNETCFVCAGTSTGSILNLNKLS